MIREEPLLPERLNILLELFRGIRILLQSFSLCESSLPVEDGAIQVDCSGRNRKAMKFFFCNQSLDQPDTGFSKANPKPKGTRIVLWSSDRHCLQYLAMAIYTQ